jgi:hypothetical protein
MREQRRFGGVLLVGGLVVATVALLLAAGCGGSTSPSVASLRTITSADTATSTSGTVPTKSSPSAFASCMTSHGFQASVGLAASAPSGSISIAGVTISGADPNSSQFQAATEACRTFLPGGGPPTLTRAQQAEAAKALSHFAACMRKNRVANFPDPTGQGRFPAGSLNQLDLSAPLFRSSYKTCGPLMSKAAPRIRFG